MRPATRSVIATLLVPLAVMAAIAPAEAQTASRKKDMFKDLPGVTMPEDELKAKIACTTELRQVRMRTSGRAYLERIYVCRDGNMTFEGNEPPDEYDWRQVRKRDGF